MRLYPLAALALTALLVLPSNAHAQRTAASPGARIDTGHTLTLDCPAAPARRRGRHTCAVTVRQRRAAAQAPWGAAVRAVALQVRGPAVGTPSPYLSPYLVALQPRADGALVGSVRLPRGARLDRVFVRGDRTRSFRVPQASEEDEDPPEEPDEPEDPPEDDPPDDEGDDDDEDDAECSVVGCDMVDPWTCECVTAMREPFGEIATSGGTTTVTF